MISHRPRNEKNKVQQGLEIHGLEEHGPWRYTVFNWIQKHLRYTDFGQKPCRYTAGSILKCLLGKNKIEGTRILKLTMVKRL